MPFKPSLLLASPVLLATLFTALGIDPYAAYDIPDLPNFHRVEDHAEPIRGVLA